MRILGIDPGTTAIGYAIIDTESGLVLEKTATLRITAAAFDLRLKELHEALLFLIKETHPHFLSVEKLFFARNVKTAMRVSEARGVILLTAALSGLTVYEYTPLEIKQSLTGNGRADKAQMAKMIQLTFPDKQFQPHLGDDAYDAIAIALTCAWRTRTRNI